MKNKKITINPKYAYQCFWEEESEYWRNAIKGCHWLKIDDVMKAKNEAFKKWLDRYNYQLKNEK